MNRSTSCAAANTDRRSERERDTPTTVEEALQLMRFGCTFAEGTIGEYDVPRFERRVLAAADFLERALATKTSPSGSLNTAFLAYKAREGNCSDGSPHPQRMASLDWALLRRAFNAGAAAGSSSNG